jgi:hypothetical protein
MECLRKDFSITDPEIDKIQKLLGSNIIFDLKRREVIKCLEPLDVQAFPGTGKTTMLVAKLAILGQKLQSTGKGICVISHTNIAGQIVKQRLANTKVGSMLAHYPNYIGTIQGFFDRFVAIPWLRAHGIITATIDDEFAIDYRFSVLDKKWKYPITKRDAINGLQYIDAEKTLALAKIFRINTQTYIHAKEAVDESIHKGIFTFHEMLLYAKLAIASESDLSRILSHRFPYVFIDESQDMNKTQLSIIQDAFSQSVCQFFGDKNQEIFDERQVPEDDSTTTANSGESSQIHMTVEDSRRFSNEIASVVNPLAISGKAMTGANKRYASITPTIILFSKSNISNVIPAFGHLILQYFSEDELRTDNVPNCYAIGFVHKTIGSDERADKFPASLTQYVDHYNAKRKEQSSIQSFSHLSEYFQYGRQLTVANRDTYLGVREIVAGFIRVANQKSDDASFHLKSRPFDSFNNLFATDELMGIRRFIFQIISNADAVNTDHWNNTLLQLRAFMEKFGNSFAIPSFIKWPANRETASTHSTVQSPNEVQYSEDGRQVNILLNSIHGVKGETHLATLVLETFWFKHCLKALLPYLEKESPRIPPKKQMTAIIKAHYVGMTRARGLLCLGIPEDEISEHDREALKRVGWKIVTTDELIDK